MKKILITGATGFIGKSICKYLLTSGRSFSGAVRSMNLDLSNTNIEYISVGEIGPNTKWNVALEGVDYVIHCAGRAHVMKETKTDELKIYRSVNVDGTKQLAEQAAKAGVKRLVFLSSVKVNGEVTIKKQNDSSKNDIKKKIIFKHSDTPNPEDSYAISKLEAEKMLWDLSAKIGLEVVVVRLPLVYGEGVKGNLARLIKLVKSNIFLPLSLIQNQRSMIGIDNLVDLLICCCEHPNALGKTFLASDGEDLSTPKLINHIASSMGRRARLFPFPIFLLKFLGSILGKKKEIDRLVESLVIDSNYTKKTLNWTSTISVEEGIRRMVNGK